MSKMKLFTLRSILESFETESVSEEQTIALDFRFSNSWVVLRQYIGETSFLFYSLHNSSVGLEFWPPPPSTDL